MVLSFLKINKDISKSVHVIAPQVFQLNRFFPGLFNAKISDRA